MPTAVERLAHLLKDAFTLDAVDGPFAQWVFNRLDTQIDAGLQSLNGATSPRALASAERQYGEVFDVLGAGAFSLGADVQRDALIFNGVNQLLGGADVFGGGGGSGRSLIGLLFGAGGGAGRVADIFGGGGGSGRGADIYGGGGGSGRSLIGLLFGDGGGAGRTDVFGGGGGSGVPAAFATLDKALFSWGADLETFGADLTHLAHANSHEALVRAEAKLASDAATLSHEAAGLSADAREFAGAFGEGGGAGVQALKQAVTPFIDDFIALGDAFGKLDQVAEWGGGGGSGTNANALIGDGGGSGKAFMAIHDGFVALDGALQGLGAPLAGLLLPAVQTPNVG